MAQYSEPMDVDGVDSDFDNNKENTYHHSNVLPCTEKGYEELDVSELNVKLRYSMTPASSPMSKSFTACLDNRHLETDESLNINNANLTRSLNSTITQNDSAIKSLRNLPLQVLPTKAIFDNNSNPSILRQLDSTTVTLAVCEGNNVENVSLPSSSSSALQTPEATTPTKEIAKDGGSPIMRGLKSVFNMFRSSQSPIPPMDSDKTSQEISHQINSSLIECTNIQALASTPIGTPRSKDVNSKRSSPYKDSIVFNDDLEKELNWKDETTIIFKQEKIPVHKLFFQDNKSSSTVRPSDSNIQLQKSDVENNFNSSVEYMDISYNESMANDKTMTDFCQQSKTVEVSITAESDNEFVDCETTFTKNDSQGFNLTNNKNSISLSVNVSNLDQDSHEINQPISNAPAKTDTPGLLVTEREIENYATPSDYYDYSKDTAELLSELDKFEFNVTTETTKTKAENISQNIQIIQHHDIVLNNAASNSDQIDNSENFIKTDFQKLQSSVIEQVQNTSTQNSTEITTLNEVLDSKHDMEVNVVLESKTILTDHDKNVVIPDDYDINIDQDIQKDQIDDIKPENNMEVPCNSEDTFNVTYTEAYDINFKEDLHVLKGAPINIHSDINTTPMKELVCDLPLPTTELSVDNTENITSATLHATHNKVEIENVSIDQPSDIPLPEEDDIEDNNMIVPCNTEGTFNVTSSLFTEGVDVTTIPATELVCDNPLLADKLSMNSTETITSDILNVTQNKVLLELENISNELPSDTPLSDEHDIVGKNISNQDLIPFSTETESEVPQVPTNIYMQVELDGTHENMSEIVNNNEDDKFNATHNSPETDNSHVFEGVIYNTENKIAITNKFGNNVQSTVECQLPEQCDIIHHSVTLNPTEVLPLSQLANNSKTPIHINDSLDQVSNIEAYMTELTTVSSCDTSKQSAVDHTNVEITDVTSEVANDLNTKYETNVSENYYIEKGPNILIKCETLNSAMNETLKENVLPDLINQTVTVSNINMDIPTANTDTSNIIQRQEKQTINSNSIKEVAGLDTPLQMKTDNADNASENDSNSDVKDDVNEVFKNNNIIQPIVENLEDSHKNSDITSENILPNSINICDDKSDETLITQNVTNVKEDLPNMKEEEEIILSESNSPYVSLMGDLDTIPEKERTSVKEIETPLSANSNSISSSPPITSKGYNFNFDEIDDPFATKTKIRVSPSIDILNSNLIKNVNKTEHIVSKKIENRRKSQPLGRNKQAKSNQKCNRSIDAAFQCNKDNSMKIQESNVVESENETKENILITDITNPSIDTTKILQNDSKDIINPNKRLESNTHVIENLPKSSLEDKSPTDSVVTISNDIKTTSSSEQSVYYSAGASSSESIQSKSVFNLPEIDDPNFNPFATKSKMRQSPPPELVVPSPPILKSESLSNFSPPQSLDTSNAIATNTVYLTEPSKNMENEDKMETELMEKDTSANISNTTSSSKITDNQNVSSQDINTEDEDTVEGPFLEIDNIMNKMPQFDDETADMMQFNDLPAHGTDENFEGGELFIDAEAYEFLLNQNLKNVVADSGKESLFLKFDPLFAKRISADGVLTSLCNVEKKQSTPTKSSLQSLQHEASPIAGPSTSNFTNEDYNISQESNEDANVTIAKPMMVVTPAVNPAVITRNKSTTPTRSNRHSMTVTSPAIAIIDRFLSMSANNSLLGQNTSIMQGNREHSEGDIALTQLRELLAEKEITLSNLRSEVKERNDRLVKMETQLVILEADAQKRLKNINELNEQLIEKTKINRSMASVVEEYEKTIASLIAENEQIKKHNAEERIRLISERDEQTAHLSSMEVSFNDIHSKYEKSKQVIFAFKHNETTFRKTIEDLVENQKKMQLNYEMLKNHATSKLNNANQELEKINRTHEAEVLKLNAMIKRKCVSITSLEETLAQKTKANEELTAICDELINKVG